MPTIMPISELRNYTDVLKEVDANNRVYLTRNGHGAYTIMTVEEADELDRLRALHNVLSDLERAEKRSEIEGWVDDDEIQNIMGLSE
ncbi:MAG: prevent-host-death protein [Butyrivibrio sp.]|nr:prevent-host-death protein [Butyrivibrio sp.]